MLRYVELLSETETSHRERCVSVRWGKAGETGEFFSILLKNHRPLRVIAKRAMVTHLGQYLLLLDHQNLAADMSRMQMAAIGQCIPLSRVEHVAGGNPNVLCFTRLQDHFSFHDKR